MRAAEREKGGEREREDLEFNPINDTRVTRGYPVQPSRPSVLAIIGTHLLSAPPHSTSFSSLGFVSQAWPVGWRGTGDLSTFSSALRYFQLYAPPRQLACSTDDNMDSL